MGGYLMEIVSWLRRVGCTRPHLTLTSLLGTGVSLQRHSTIVGAERAMAANDDRNPGGVGKAAGAYSACAR